MDTAFLVLGAAVHVGWSPLLVLGIVAGVGRMAGATAQFGWPNVMRLAMACTYTSRSRWTLQRAVARGELIAAGRRGRSRTFLREDLDRWLLGSPADEDAGTPTVPMHRSGMRSSTDALARLQRVVRSGGSR